jgi:protein gp37
MSAQSKIEWTDATWNPVRGCTQISPGCKNCYAKTFAERWRGLPKHPFEHGFDLRLVPEKLADPLRWASSKLIFVNSMSDLFHPLVPDSYIQNVGRVMSAADWHIYQVLTKRPERMCDALNGVLSEIANAEHIWWGVSVENRKHGLPRVNMLRESAANVKFLSVEPLLEDLGDFDLSGIDWVIVGGESGPGARPIDRKWVVRLRDLCAEAKVPFFFKQWGGTRKHLTGHELDGVVYQAFPPLARKCVPELGARQERLGSLQLEVA